MAARKSSLAQDLARYAPESVKSPQIFPLYQDLIRQRERMLASDGKDPKQHQTMGAMLADMQRRIPQSDWPALCRSLGVGQGNSRRLIALAQRFARGEFGQCSVAQLYLLTSLNDDELARLAEGGRVARFTLRQMAKLSPPVLAGLLKVRTELDGESDMAGFGAAVKVAITNLQACNAEQGRIIDGVRGTLQVFIDLICAGGNVKLVELQAETLMDCMMTLIEQLEKARGKDTRIANELSSIERMLPAAAISSR
ncbi:MAG: hypothetical protein ABS43_06350 [Bordetella sp. SCN 67-23]|nr:hypothetical protein [Burkholderiales bacterium]ODS75220.1 MAG: hypothetical protein ABS43_06350 [Bordetella sp. SCN 67-23]OJW93375.1 MAG: hypothetical protein BGO71_15425 [Burkholderiales bacterium 67-32]